MDSEIPDQLTNLEKKVVSEVTKQIKAVTSCNTHKIDQQETDG